MAIFILERKYHPENEADAAILLYLLDNVSDIDLRDDEVGEKENEFKEPQINVVRLGADRVGTKTTEI